MVKEWMFISGVANSIPENSDSRPDIPESVLKGYFGYNTPSPIPGVYLQVTKTKVNGFPDLYGLQWSCHHGLTPDEFVSVNTEGITLFRGFKVTKGPQVKKAFTVSKHGWQGAYTLAVKARARMLGIEYIWDDPEVASLDECISWLQQDKGVDPKTLDLRFLENTEQ